MSSSAAAAKKRKLSAVDNDNFSSLKRKEPHSPERNLSGPINCLDLPLPLWAEVFHFLEYKDARACLLVCRFVANQVSKHVKHLHVMRSCELEVRSARRFPNVVDININCLLRQDDHDDDSTQRIVPESVGRIVPFLSAFRHLQEANVFRDETYNAVLCATPIDHGILYRALLISLVGAFQANLLDRSLHLTSIIGSWQKKFLCLNGAGGCDFCRSLLQHMPLNILASAYGIYEGHGHAFDFCFSEADVKRMIKHRTWTKQCIEATSRYVVNTVLGNDLVVLSLIPSSNFIKDHEAMKPLLDKALDSEWIYYIPDKRLSRLEFLVSLGCHVNIPSKSDALEMICDEFGSGGYLLLKSTFDRLVNAGYPFEPTDFVLINEEEFPSITNAALLKYELEFFNDMPGRTST